MGFLDTIVNPAGAAPTGGSIAPTQPKSFLSSVVPPSATGPTPAQTRAYNVTATTGASQIARANSDYANSFKGQAMNTLKGLWPASGIPEQFNQGVVASKDKTPGFLGTLGRIGGVATAVTAPLAPVFNPAGLMGKGINAAGNAFANAPRLNPKVPTALESYGKDLSSSPPGTNDQPERILGGIANAANIAGTVLGAKEAFTPKVKGGFLDTVDTPAKTEAPAAKPEPTAPAEKPIAQAHAEYAKQQGYKPVETPATEAPKSPATPRAGEAVKVMAETATPKPESTTEGVGNIKPVEGGGEFHTAGSAASAVASMTKDELTTQVKDLPGFNAENWGHQSDFATTVATGDRQTLLDMLGDKKPLPNGLLGSALTTAAKNLAKLTGDGELAAAVAHSPLHLQVSRAAQEMGYLGANADPIDQVRLGRDVERAREAVARPERARQAVETARTARRSTTTITRPRVKEFIKSVTCGY